MRSLTTNMTDENLPYHLALLRIKGIGIKRCHKLLKHYPKLENFFNLPAQQLRLLGLDNQISAIKNPDWQAVECDLKWLDQSSMHTILTLNDSNYPQLLKMITYPPTLLFVAGDKTILNEPQLAMVGSRNPTPTGLEHAFKFAYSLAKAGLVITSGLALGIDAKSHEGTLAAKSPTIAVMGTGMGSVYPNRHENLAQRIMDTGGALVSEFVAGTGPRRENFPIRNRIISAMALGVLVVEAAVRSGSLITARYASEQGKEIYAIPGSIDNPFAKGCHELLKDGAKLVESIQDILEEIAPQLQLNLTEASKKTTNNQQSLQLNLTEASEKTTNNMQPHDRMGKFLDEITFEPAPVDVIIQRTNFSPQQVNSFLMQLELEGLVTKSAYGYQKNKIN